MWLLLIGPPSSGKTEALGALSDLPEAHFVSTFTEAGLLTGSPTRDDSTATGGLLRQVGERGLIVASDFGTLLNEHGSTRNRIFACLREVFDGRFIRVLGTNGGTWYGWSGHAGFIGACTEAIDAPSIDLGVLGERFTYYRLPEVTHYDEFLTCTVVDEHAGHQADVRVERSVMVRRFLEDLPLPEEFPPIGEDEQTRLITMANLCATCRSSVVREGYSREIEFVPEHERSTRLYVQFRHLHAGLTVIGTPGDEIWRLLAKVALDGMHPGRRAVVDYFMAHPGAHTTAVIAGYCRLPTTPTRRHLQDLCAHGVIDLAGDYPERWVASDWLREVWWAVGDATPRVRSPLDG